MHDGEGQPVGVARRTAFDQLVRAPRRAWNDQRRTRERQRPDGRSFDGAPDEVGAEAPDLADTPVLDPVRGARPNGFAQAPVAVPVLRFRLAPPAPATRERPRPEEHLTR